MIKEQRAGIRDAYNLINFTNQWTITNQPMVNDTNELMANGPRI